MTRKMFIIGGLAQTSAYCFILGVLWTFWQQSILWFFIGTGAGFLFSLAFLWLVSRDMQD